MLCDRLDNLFAGPLLFRSTVAHLRNHEIDECLDLGQRLATRWPKQTDVAVIVNVLFQYRYEAAILERIRHNEVG
jgi:hypothetical protein